MNIKFLDNELFMDMLKVKALNEELVENEAVRDKDGYLKVILYKNGKPKSFQVHRLVASAFIENPLNLSEVNHRDENPSNNRVENLEWCTRKYNMNYGTRLEKQLANPNCGIKQLKPILQFTKNGELVKEYPSLMEASRLTQINQGNISSCCNGKLHSAGKYLWKYKEECVA